MNIISFSLNPESYAPWLAPYAYIIVLLGFAFFLFRVFENWFGSIFNKPLYRHIFIYKKLSSEQLIILKNDFPFFNLLSEKHKKQFGHRIVHFLSEKEFIGRDSLVVTEKMKLLVSAIGCMVSFGRKNYNYRLLDFILIYPKEFFSNTNNQFHKGEFNPREKALVFSWKDFEEGYKITDDNYNLGIHEFMHAMQLEATNGGDLDSNRFIKQYQNILKVLQTPEVKKRLEDSQFFRAYAFTNQYEFMAVLGEYFFESPKEFKTQFPELYNCTKKLLNFKYAGY